MTEIRPLPARPGGENCEPPGGENCELPGETGGENCELPGENCESAELAQGEAEPGERAAMRQLGGLPSGESSGELARLSVGLNDLMSRPAGGPQSRACRR